MHVFKSSAGSINMPYTEEQDVYIVERLQHYKVTEKLRQNEPITYILRPVYADFRAKYTEYTSTFSAFKDHWDYLVSTGQAEGKTAPATLTAQKKATQQVKATPTWAPAKGSQRTRNLYTIHMKTYAFALEQISYECAHSDLLTTKERWQCIYGEFIKKFTKYRGTPSALYTYCTVLRRKELKKQTPAAQQSERDTSPQKESEVEAMLSSKSSPSKLQTDTDTELETDWNYGLPESQVVFNVPMGAVVKDPMDVLVPETWSADEDVFNTKKCPENVINEPNQWLGDDDMEEMNKWLGEDVIKQPEVREDVHEDDPKKRAKFTIRHDMNVSLCPEGPMQRFLIF